VEGAGVLGVALGDHVLDVGHRQGATLLVRRQVLRQLRVAEFLGVIEVRAAVTPT